VARTAIERAREAGIRAGIFRPITLWPFPAARCATSRGVRAVLVLELSAGQMVEDVRLASSGACRCSSTAERAAWCRRPGEVGGAARSWHRRTGPP
jgi:2-oxoglutarate/2-oxoacid ferredoxin oxidoreductase subunit alpha